MMNLIRKTNLIIAMLVGFLMPALAQKEAVDADNGEYAKSNIAISKFSILGVTQRQYARCVQTVNYLEPEKTMKMLVIETTVFVDDGQGYDLKAGDGILTSTQLYNYENNVHALPGTYRESVDYNTVVADEGFNFLTEVNQTSRIGISCTFKWVPCNQQTPPAQAALCNWAGWPYGSFIVTECHLDWSWL